MVVALYSYLQQHKNIPFLLKESWKVLNPNHRQVGAKTETITKTHLSRAYLIGVAAEYFWFLEKRKVGIKKEVKTIAITV